MKSRSFYTILAGVVGLLLGVAAIILFWLLAQSPLGLLKAGQDKAPAAAMFVPRQAPAMMSLLVNPAQLESFRVALATPGERRRARTEVAQLKQTLLANTGLTYAQDIQPWLGDELTLAITTLDIDRDPVNGKQPGYLLAVATKNAEQSREFLQLFWQKRAIAGSDLVFEQYKGVKLLYGSGAEAVETKAKGKKQKPKNETPYSSLIDSPSLASAVVGDRFVLFANHPKVLRDAVTNVQATDLNLSHASFYTKTLETLDQPRIGLSFINLPGMASWLSDSSLTGSEAKVSSTPGGTVPYQTMAIALRLDRQGLLADTALVGAGNQDKPVVASLSQPVGAMQFLPGNSLVAAAGTNLDRLWLGISQDLSNYATGSKLVNQPLKDLQTRWQIDLPQDIFRWVKGEYALGLVPAPEGVRSQESGAKKSPAKPAINSRSEWVFVAQRSPSESANQAIAHLDEIAKQQGLSVGPLTLGNQTIAAWTRLTTGTGQQNSAPLALQAEVRGVHASVGNYEIFTPSIAMMDRVLQATDDPLTKRDQFQQAIAPMQRPNNGYLYLDWSAVQPLLEQRFPLLRVIELAGKPLFSHLRSITISSYGSQSGIQRSGVFMKLS